MTSLTRIHDSRNTNSLMTADSYVTALTTYCMTALQATHSIPLLLRSVK